MSVLISDKDTAKICVQCFTQKNPKSKYQNELIFIRAFEGVQKTRRRVLAGIKTLGETPAHFLQSMFSLEHFTSAGT